MPLLQIGKRADAPSALLDTIYLSVSSEGFGHSSRALAICSRFQPEEVVVATYGYALERVRAAGCRAVAVPQEVKFVGVDGSFDVGRTILHNPARALGLNQIVQDEMALMRALRVSLVVADGRIAPVLAAARLDLPCLVLTNQSAFYPFFERDSALVKLFGRSFEWVMKFWLSSAEEILIPDFPPPDTVCLPNLSDNFQVKKRTRFVGPLVPWRAEDVTAIPRFDDPRPLVVVSLGGHSYRRPLFDAVLSLAAQRPDIAFLLLTSFTAEDLPPNVSLRGMVHDAAAYFKAADLVITQAGHSTAMELLTLGKPSVVVPDARQIEQENNAQRLCALGVSVQVRYADLDGVSLGRAVDRLLTTPSYTQEAQRLALRAETLHGAEAAASVLRDYAKRLSIY